MNPAHHYQFSALLTCIINIGLLWIVLTKGTNRKLVKAFQYYCSSIIIWSFFVVLATTVPTPKFSLIFSQLCHAAATLIPLFFLHFVYELLSLNRKSNLVYFFNGVAGIFICIVLFVPAIFFDGVSSKFGFPYFPNAGKLYSFWAFYFFLLVGFTHFQLFRATIKSEGVKQSHLKLFLIANLLGYLGGVGCFLPSYGIDVFPFPYGPYGVVLFSLVTAYSIFMYRFMDVEVIIKKTIIFAGIAIATVACIAIPIAIAQVIIGKALLGNINPFFLMILGVITAILINRPVERLLIKITDTYLFQKKEGIRVVLERLSESISTILDIDELGNEILSTLRDTFRLTSGVILMKGNDESYYRMLDAFGIDDKNIEFAHDDIFIRYLSETGQIINFEMPGEELKIPVELSSQLKSIRAVVAIPLFVQKKNSDKELMGILFLGKKKSDQEFTSEEMDYFPAMARQVAIALHNARLMDIQKKSQIDFAQQAKLAALGTLSAGISHEIKNPINQISMAASMFKIKEKNHLYDHVPIEDFKKEVFEALQRVEGDAKRVNDIIERLSAFSKKPKELKLEPVNVVEVIDAVLGIIEKSLQLEGIAVEKDYKHDLPMILANFHAVEEVILNLVVNAKHTIKERALPNGKISISVSKDDSHLQIAVKDTGKGIAPENMGKIFDPFFTTKDVSRNNDPNAIKGTGLGLHLVREIVKQYGGKITLESQQNIGTTFHVFFPFMKG